MSQVRFELYGPESEKARKYWCDAVDEISDAVVELNEWSARDDVVLVPGSHDRSAVVSLDDIGSFVETWGQIRCPVFYDLSFSACLADREIDFENLDDGLIGYPEELLDRIARPLLRGWAQHERKHPTDVPLGVEVFFPWQGVVVSFLLVSGYCFTPGMYLNRLDEEGQVSEKVRSCEEDYSREASERLERAKERLREFLLNDPMFEKCTNKELRREYIDRHIDDPLFLDVYSRDSPSDPNRCFFIHVALADLTGFYQAEIRPRLRMRKQGQ